MGLLRRMESGVQRGFEGVFARGGKGDVEPTELMRKLVRELEDHRTRSLSRTYVPNRFTVFLRPQDRERFRSYEPALKKELESHLLQHVRREGYDLVAPIRVLVNTDGDLRRGQFGILGEMVDDSDGSAGGRESASAPDAAEASESAAASAVPGSSQTAAAEAAASPAGGPTESISPQEAAKLGLARQSLLLRHGAHVQEYEKSRVIIGRARDADFRLDDPNVSRQHALVYWEDGRLFLRDLGSTNGTLVNGRPVTSASLADGDVITVGGAQISVGTG
jgi:hypothetical protein